MSRTTALLGCALLAWLTVTPATAGLQERDRRPVNSPRQPRIISVYTTAELLFVAGQNLPAGEGTEVRLGDRVLEIVESSRALLVARLPELELDEAAALEVRRGVRRARIRGDRLRWGLQLPSIYR